MIVGFLALALGTAAAGVALWVRRSVGIAGRVGAAMVLLAGPAMVVVDLNQQDCSELIGACSAAEAAARSAITTSSTSSCPWPSSWC
jgi:hypothetical protein